MAKRGGYKREGVVRLKCRECPAGIDQTCVNRAGKPMKTFHSSRMTDRLDMEKIEMFGEQMLDQWALTYLAIKNGNSGEPLALPRECPLWIRDILYEAFPEIDPCNQYNAEW